MEWKIEVRNKRRIFDPLGSGIKKDIKDLGIVGVKKISTAQVFNVCGDLSQP
ncbi:phosphoribosylformylglycinamidine synthase subunit PurS [Candidatus Omnitrophota bacterium]